ncbi:flagellin [uncultured Clostridium sp.]|uniref:flagellin N-terminal helical domain-containing protein n=1 Tax=uncultured Clostridium sp. TaxID=59620 RepID=UPI0025E4803B|nr:flagellin [uncultured Clostridium sp.]
MIINHNMNALNAHRNMTANTATSGKSMEKLSSGLRINRAGDDAAGLAISEKMRGQIRGLDQASRNAQDGISMIQTAEGALNETHSILQRMRELSVQSSNDTNNDSDREQIQKEIDQLTSEIDRIAETTEFNTKKLLNGDADVKATVTGTGAAKVTGASDKTKTGSEVKITGSTLATNATYTTTIETNANIVTDTTIDIGGKTITLATGLDKAKIVEEVNKQLKEKGISATASASAANKLVITANEAGSAGKMDVKVGNAAATEAGGADATVTIAGQTVTGKGNVITLGDESGDAKGLKLELTTAGKMDVKVDSVGSNLQIGANQGQNIALQIGDMRSEALGVSGIDVTNAKNADEAVTTIQSAIDAVSNERAKLGAYQNRLEHTINNLGTSSENLTAAESRVRDVDMAKEMMTFSKNNILAQAAQSMLAQANQQPQQVLSLLR